MSQIHTLSEYFITDQLKAGIILLMEQLSKYSVLVSWVVIKEPFIREIPIAAT